MLTSSRPKLYTPTGSLVRTVAADAADFAAYANFLNKKLIIIN